MPLREAGLLRGDPFHVYDELDAQKLDYENDLLDNGQHGRSARTARHGGPLLGRPGERRAVGRQVRRAAG